MARVLMTLLGLILLALGVWLIILWWPQVAALLLALVAIACALLGLALLIFGISEIAGAAKKKDEG